MNVNNPAPAGPTDGAAAEAATGIDIRRLTPMAFARLGMEQVAYVRPVMVNGVPAWAIHAADGSPMGVAESADLAMAAIVQHEMIPVRVH